MGEIYISSRTNPTVAALSSLQSKKGRRETGLFLCEGKKLCREALGKCSVSYALIKEGCDGEELRSIAELSGGQIIILSEGAFGKISCDSAPDGIIFAVKIPEQGEKIQPRERVFAMECVRDPGNVGTVIRTAAAFGIDRIILADCADVYNPKTVRAAMGALFNVKITVCDDFGVLIPELKKQGRRVISAALTGTSVTLGKTSLLPTDCLVVGNEGHGISDKTLEMSDETVIIPMTDKTESLNAATASAVLLWELLKTFGLQ